MRQNVKQKTTHCLRVKRSMVLLFLCSNLLLGLIQTSMAQEPTVWFGPSSGNASAYFEDQECFLLERKGDSIAVSMKDVWLVPGYSGWWFKVGTWTQILTSDSESVPFETFSFCRLQPARVWGGRRLEKLVLSSNNRNSQPRVYSDADSRRIGLKQAQEQLTKLGHYSGLADDIAGPETRKAIRSFQSACGLPATGEMDKKTFEVLMADSSLSLVTSKQTRGGRPGFEEVPLGNMPSEGVLDAAWSEDGCHLAVVVQDQDKYMVILDGQQGSKYDGIVKGSLAFSPDGKRFAYGATIGGEQCMVVDGQHGAKHKGIGNPAFSSDGRHIAYPAGFGTTWAVIVDGKPEMEFNFILGGTLSFSPDGEHFAYAARRGNQCLVIIDGQSQRLYDSIDGIGGLKISDGGRVAYAIGKNGKMAVVVDSTDGDVYDGITKGSLAFCSRGQRVLYSAWSGSKYFVVVDGQASRAFDMVGHTSFSSDGKRYACQTRTGVKEMMFVDGESGPEFDRIGIPVFSPDGKRLAYGAKTGDSWKMIADGLPGQEYEIIGTPVFHPDGSHFAYAAKKDNVWTVVIDDKSGAGFDGISDSSIGYSPDGEHLAYSAKRSDKWVMIMNGKPSSEYELIVKGGPRFHGDGTLEFLAIRNGVLYRVLGHTSFESGAMPDAFVNPNSGAIQRTSVDDNTPEYGDMEAISQDALYVYQSRIDKHSIALTFVLYNSRPIEALSVPFRVSSHSCQLVFSSVDFGSGRLSDWEYAKQIVEPGTQDMMIAGISSFGSPKDLPPGHGEICKVVVSSVDGSEIETLTVDSITMPKNNRLLAIESRATAPSQSVDERSYVPAWVVADADSIDKLDKPSVSAVKGEDTIGVRQK